MLNKMVCRILAAGTVMLAPLAYSSTVDEKVVASDFVFEGVVVDVQTRFSERDSKDDPAIPYRFVTYSINRILKGNYQQNQVTLRFLGGEAEDGQVLLIPGQPLFDVGDHDMLMVKGNNRYPCPLVQCAEGRYRYLGGMVVNELGQRIYLDANGQIVMGEKIENENLNTNQLSENVTIETRDVHEIDPEEITNISEEYPNATTADPSGFSETVDEKIRQNHTQEQLANLPEFVSSDPDQPFVDETYEKAGGGSSVGQAPALGGDIAADMPEDERIERELEAAILADLEQQNLSPERQKELQARNKEMEQKYPDFYVQEEGMEIISSANANGVIKVAKTDAKEEGASKSGYFFWLAGFVLLAGVGGVVWYRQHRA